MGESKDKLIRAIRHYQDSLERHTKTGNIEKLLHAIEKLARLPIKVCHLEETGVGRTVNGLKRFEGSVGENARTLVDQWKSMVKDEEEEQARIAREQQLAENEENEMVEDEPDPESLQIIDQQSPETSHSSLKKSSSFNKSSHSNSRPSSSDKRSKSEDRHDKKSKQQHSSDSSDSDNRSKKQKSDKSDKSSSHKRYKESERDSDSDDSKSSREASPRGTKNKNKSRRLPSESSDKTSSDSEDSSIVKDIKQKSKYPKKRDSSASRSDSDRHEQKNMKHKKSASESDSKSKDKHQSNKSRDKSEDKSRDKSDKRDKDRESSTKRDSSSSKTTSKPLDTDFKHKKEESKKPGRSSDKKEETRKETSKTHKENKDSQDKKRSRECSADRNSKRHKGESSSTSKSEKKKDKESKKDKSESEKSKKSTPDSKSKSAKEKDHLKAPKKKLLDSIDSGSGTSFADALGMLEAPVYSKSKKKTAEEKPSLEKGSSTSKEKSFSPISRSTAEGPSSANDTEEVPKLLKDSGNLEPLDINISSLLPSITPNYRPLGMPLDGPNRKAWTDDETLTRVISAKHQRTKVYSGNKSSYTKVPSLFELCSRILQDNLDALEYTGGVPYSILKHILERANPDQLYQLEFHNPYLIEDTDELWQLHCQREFRNKKREELESWREMYMRCLDEREAKLKALTANIKQSQDKSLPVRQTKLAYVDSVVKPPRNIARKQRRRAKRRKKNGTAVDLKRPSQTPAERLSQLAKAGEASKAAVPNPGRVAVDRGTSSSSTSGHNPHIKPKKAPLMAKTLSLLKNRFGRR